MDCTHQSPDQRRGEADCGEYCEAAGAIAQALNYFSASRVTKLTPIGRNGGVLLRAEDFGGFRIDQMHLRTDRAVYRHERAFLCWLIFQRDIALHRVARGRALEQKGRHKHRFTILVPANQLRKNS